MRTEVSDMALVALKRLVAVPHPVLMVRKGVRPTELTPVDVGVHRIMSEPELRDLRRPRLPLLVGGRTRCDPSSLHLGPHVHLLQNRHNAANLVVTGSQDHPL